MKRIHIILIACVLIAGSLTVLALTRDKSKTWKTESKEEIARLRKKQANKRAHIRDLQKYMDGIHIAFGQEKSQAPANYLMAEYTKVKSATGKFKAAGDVEWIHRGPSNVGGRTRGLIVDPDDASHKTWFAGSATGGVWKTTDAGRNWICLTDDLPYQATTTLAMSKSNHNIIYMGTGESFTYDVCGGGLFKSSNKGDSWEHLASTADNENFRFVNRIEVDPDNEDIVLVATTTGIFKSIDGGTSWSQTYTSANSVEDLVADTSNFNYIFASVNTVGVLRSSDAGDSWEDVTDGFAAGFERIELAISPTNPQKIYASVEKSDADYSELYSSWDRGDKWQKVINNSGPSYNFLGRQGFYDNTMAVHPYDENIVFWGGVNLWKVNLTSTTQDGEASVTSFDTINTGSFLAFIPFDGNLLNGMNTGDQEDAIDLLESDFVSVEIRFGPGMTQKAHRFYVPLNETAGVADSLYTFQDYVDVPFEVWDVTNNKQLMCSFRDQERDGEFNLYERTGENYEQLGREYIFVHAVLYNASVPDPNISTLTRGRSYKLIYFFWPTLAEDGIWDPENLPDSKISIEWGIIQERLGAVENVSDAYASFSERSGGNNYNQSGGINTTSIPGFHPDHHEILMIPVNDVTEDFWILNANDGGLGISYDQGDNFTQLKRGYYTTQFYGVAKKPYRNEYIGGMQDNGTWQSPGGIDASLDTGFYFRIGGDGFETVWNHQNSKRILASVYNNAIYRSLDSGRTWVEATTGITEGDGPFITRLTPVPSNNKIIFAVGKSGLYKTANFTIGGGWIPVPIGAGWLGTNYTAVTSSHNVKVSPVNEQIIWAGAAMLEENGWKMFVSTDQGESFSPVTEPNEPIAAFISGLAVHPTQENTAYVLYSLYNSPKILRTTDLGETWEDITQVGADGNSANGFPNVGCLSLMVFPDSINKIWAGTEIGIMESKDNGETWHYLESNLPSVSIFQMYMQDNQVVVATYGRGIWTYQYGPELEPPVAIEDMENTDESISVYPNPSTGIVNIDLSDITGGEKCDINVFALDGKQVYHERADITPNSKIRLDLSSLRNGAYILTVNSSTVEYSSRILIQ